MQLLGGWMGEEELGGFHNICSIQYHHSQNQVFSCGPRPLQLSSATRSSLPCLTGPPALRGARPQRCLPPLRVPASGCSSLGVPFLPALRSLLPQLSCTHTLAQSKLLPSPLCALNTGGLLRTPSEHERSARCDFQSLGPKTSPSLPTITPDSSRRLPTLHGGVRDHVDPTHLRPLTMIQRPPPCVCTLVPDPSAHLSL